LLIKREKELASVVKLVGGVDETRYQAGRGTIPFKPVAGNRQRKAVKFLLERGFTRPDALLDPEVLWRIAPAGRTDALQGTNQKLLGLLVNQDVFHRMAEGATYPGAGVAYQGTDLLLDLNDGLFRELKQANPQVDLYRRDLQRAYVTLLMARFSSSDGPSEFKVALRAGITDVAIRLDQALKKVRDAQTRGHLKDLRAALE
jgi:hypothetical protein